MCLQLFWLLSAVPILKVFLLFRLFYPLLFRISRLLTPPASSSISCISFLVLWRQTRYGLFHGVKLVKVSKPLPRSKKIESQTDVLIEVGHHFFDDKSYFKGHLTFGAHSAYIKSFRACKTRAFLGWFCDVDHGSRFVYAEWTHAHIKRLAFFVALVGPLVARVCILLEVDDGVCADGEVCFSKLTRASSHCSLSLTLVQILERPNCFDLTSNDEQMVRIFFLPFSVSASTGHLHSLVLPLSRHTYGNKIYYGSYWGIDGSINLAFSCLNLHFVTFAPLRFSEWEFKKASMLWKYIIWLFAVGHWQHSNSLCFRL